MVRFSATLSLLVAAARAATTAAESMTTITLGQDTNYPPYAFKTDDGQLAGFGKDFADGMTALCDDVEIVVVEEKWNNCWSSEGGGTLGASIANGTLDGCMTYTHTQGVRDEQADFSDAILDLNKAAGLLTLLDEDGSPAVKGFDDLAGKTIIDVGGWAPTADGLDFVENKCSDMPYSNDYELLVANGEQANDVAMKMLRDGEGDAIFIYADQAYEYANCREGAEWNCTLWQGFGTEYAYVQTGQFGYVVNGTTLALSRKGSGIREKLRPCMTKFIATKEYYDICVKHNLVSDCYSNEFFLAEDEGIDKTILPTDEQPEDCSDGYCPCPTKEEDDAEEVKDAGNGDITDIATTDEVKPKEEDDAGEVKDAGNGGNVMFGHYASISVHIISGFFFMLMM